MEVQIKQEVDEFESVVVKEEFCVDGIIVPELLNENSDVAIKSENPDELANNDNPEQFVQFEITEIHEPHASEKVAETIRCLICKHTFRSKHDRGKHMITDHGRQYYYCAHCPTKFVFKWSLRVHLLHHTRKAKVRCFVCKKNVPTISALYRHVQKHYNGKCYKCSICKKRYYDSTYLVNHIHNVHTVRSERNLELHYKCDICHMKIITAKLLKRHKLIEHGEKSSFKCPYCERNFAREATIESHISVDHRGLPVDPSIDPLACTVCKEEFGDLDTLRKHVMVHSIETSYKCQICQKKYLTAGAIKQHVMLDHKSIQPDTTDAKTKKLCNMSEKDEVTQGCMDSSSSGHLSAINKVIKPSTSAVTSSQKSTTVPSVPKPTVMPSLVPLLGQMAKAATSTPGISMQQPARMPSLVPLPGHKPKSVISIPRISTMPSLVPLPGQKAKFATSISGISMQQPTRMPSLVPLSGQKANISIPGITKQKKFIIVTQAGSASMPCPATEPKQPKLVFFPSGRSTSIPASSTPEICFVNVEMSSVFTSSESNSFTDAETIRDSPSRESDESSTQPKATTVLQSSIHQMLESAKRSLERTEKNRETQKRDINYIQSKMSQKDVDRQIRMQIIRQLPMKSLEDLLKFDEQFSDSNFEDQFITVASCRELKDLITDELAFMFNYSGRSGKLALRNFKFMIAWRASLGKVESAFKTIVQKDLDAAHNRDYSRRYRKNHVKKMDSSE